MRLPFPNRLVGAWALALGTVASTTTIGTAAQAQGIGGGRRVVFVRGGAGSGGFLEGGADEQLSDINDFSTSPGNHGFGELAELLRGDGFVVEQVVEPSGPEAPVRLADLDLGQVSILVLGSNNATYGSADAEILSEFVASGGGVLLASDANWGDNWGDAPSSDQPFLTPFDLVVNQDRGTYVLRRSSGDFVIGGVDRGDHPILVGVDGILGTADDVDVIDGEGVSPLTVTGFLGAVDPVVLIRARGTIRLNDNPSGGSTRNATAADGTLIVAEYGAGRVAGHFDRNTFFNENGAGTSLHRYDNTKYARSLFAWLAGPNVQSFGEGKLNSVGIRPTLGARGTPSVTSPVFDIVVHTGVPDRAGLFIQGPGYIHRPLDGGFLLVRHPRRLPMVQLDNMGKATQSIPVLPGLVGTRRYFQFWYRDPGEPSGYDSGLSNGLRVAFVQ